MASESGTSFARQLVAICGIDGSGKTTQCNLLVAYLEGLGIDASIAKVKWSATKSIFLLAEYETGDPYRYHPLIPPTLREFVIACDVASYFRDSVAPGLRQGSITLLDRAPMCYRSYARAYGADVEWIDRMYATIPQPAITILLDLDADISYQRLLRRTTKEIHADETLPLLRRARSGYLDVMDDYSRVHLIDAEQCQEDVHIEIRNLILQYKLGTPLMISDHLAP